MEDVHVKVGASRLRGLRDAAVATMQAGVEHPRRACGGALPPSRRRRQRSGRPAPWAGRGCQQEGERRARTEKKIIVVDSKNNK